METLRAAVRSASAAVGVAQAELAAAERTAESARATVPLAVERARADGRRAAAELRLADSELRGARAGLALAEHKRTLAAARVRILRHPADIALERVIVASAGAEAARTQSVLQRLALRTGVAVPADEMLFFQTLPVRVDSVTGRRGSQLAGPVMYVTNSRLAIDSTLSIADAKLVRPGLRVTIEEPDLGSGRSAGSAGSPTSGTTPPDLAVTTPVDPSRTYVEDVPQQTPPALVGASVKLSIAVESTKGRVLAVPIGAPEFLHFGTSSSRWRLNRSPLRVSGRSAPLCHRPRPLHVAPPRRPCARTGTPRLPGRRGTHTTVAGAG